MSYRNSPPTLDMEGIHLCCICGNNGHGKSALLDAMTWALWGEARAKTQEELICQGQSDMAVELEFLARGQRYKVIRKHSRSGRSRQGSSILELYGEQNGSFKAISGNTIRDTEVALKKLLHMDYATFISSAFLMQGKADQFTASPPSERKKTLVEILDLSYYGELETKAKEISRLRESDMRQTEGALGHMQTELQRRPEYEAKLAQANDQLARIMPQVEEKRSQVETLQRSFDSVQTQKQELETLRRQVQSIQQDLMQFEKEAKSYPDRIARLALILQRAGEGEVDKARLKLEEIEREKLTLREKTEQLQTLSSEIHRLKSENTKLMADMKELRTKFDLLSEGQLKCPLCNQPLGPDGLQHLKTELEAQGKEQKRLYQSNEARSNSLETQRQKLSQQTTEMERDIEKRGREAQTRLLTIEKDTRDAQAFLPDEKAKLQRLQELMARRKQELAEASARQESLSKGLQDLPRLTEDLQMAQRSLKDFTQQQLAYMSEQRAMEHHIQQCDQLQKEAEVKQRELEKLQREKSIYDELTIAFGKSGVQALLIESVLPQLESDANELLNRLTNNRMNVKLETQRERKAKQGDPLETLEIKISDELGTRNYETFSGGEAFRINFALRIALSKLLARRAGVPLPILFIDEGFGTQDASGRERLLEVIKSIEGDFEKIFVITHIDELKDAFPVRIEVTKTESGSAYAVV